MTSTGAGEREFHLSVPQFFWPSSGAKAHMQKHVLRHSIRRLPRRVRSRWYGSERPKFLGPLEAEYPPWLTGEAPADYGFDPLALSQEPAAFDRNFELEILHARWAMLGLLGAVVPGVPLSAAALVGKISIAKLGHAIREFLSCGARLVGNLFVVLMQFSLTSPLDLHRGYTYAGALLMVLVSDAKGCVMYCTVVRRRH